MYIYIYIIIYNYKSSAGKKCFTGEKKTRKTNSSGENKQKNPALLRMFAWIEVGLAWI